MYVFTYIHTHTQSRQYTSQLSHYICTVVQVYLETVYMFAIKIRSL